MTEQKAKQDKKPQPIAWPFPQWKNGKMVAARFKRASKAQLAESVGPALF
jgi:hypothetical protein